MPDTPTPSATAGAFLDAASGAPPHPLARQALAAALDDGWADPARLYGAGRRAAALLDAARDSMAESLRVRPDELSFTSSGTQALHLAVLGTLAGGRPGRFVHSAVEHSAVLHAAEKHVHSQSVGVDRFGRVDPDAFVAACTNATTTTDATAAALQAANHEVGTTQPVTEVAGRVGVPLVVDATQTVGHADVPDGWSVLAADARTWGGGTAGVLVVRTGTRWRSPNPADERERGRVPGVPNLPAIVAAAASLRAVEAERAATAARHSRLIAKIRDDVTRTIPDVDLQGDPDHRLPHLVTFSCLYVDGEALLHALDRRGFAVSSGSSCTSSTLEPSHVLVAMGALTSGNVRVSLHERTTEAEVDEFLAVLPGVVADVRAELGAQGL